jgi:NitT/TauT family transport system substrate-binding protein
MNARKLRSGVTLVTVLSLLAVAVLAGCSASSTAPQSGGGSTAASSGVDTTKQAAPAPVRIGALPNEDSLPLWVAEQTGIFKKLGLDVKITTFASAAERDAALQAGSVDMVSGDIIAAGLLSGHGFPVKIATIQLGATPKEGRFGILAAKNSGLTTLADLTTKGALAQSPGTLATYVADKLFTQAGIDPAKVKRIVVPKLPVRFQLLEAGKVPAAVLPEPLLSLGVKDGLKLLADDTTGANISQTVLIVSDKFLAAPGGKLSLATLLAGTDQAVAIINKDPNAQRALLVDKARLPAPIAQSYQINTYPTHQLPTQQQVDDVLAWMKANKLLPADSAVSYQSLTAGN